MGSALKGHKKSHKPQEVFAEGPQGNQELPGVPSPSVGASPGVCPTLWPLCFDKEQLSVPQRQVKLSDGSAGWGQDGAVPMSSHSQE